jgi:2-hydroxycyclohexanecarboxyl-CoA dehydrogenase
MPEAQLTGKVGYVTGGGSAIGAAAVRALLAAGASVVVTGRTQERLDEVAALDAQRVRTFAMDVGDEAAWDRLAAFGGEAGAPGAIVAVAGVAYRGPFVESRPEEWDAMWRTNVVGAMLAARTFLPEMTARGYGRVVLVSSAGARIGLADRAAYTATKGALESFVRSLAVEVAGSGVTVNAVSPGAMPTPASRAWLDANPQLAEQTLAAIPEGRFGDAAELEAAFAFVLSASYCQGSTVTVDGGWTIA